MTARIEVRRVEPDLSNPTVRAYHERLEDWHDEGSHILDLFAEHRRRYEAKICSKCDDAQKVKRDCNLVHADRGNRPWCMHMNRAAARALKKHTDAHMAHHPLMERITMNAALARREGA